MMGIGRLQPIIALGEMQPRAFEDIPKRCVVLHAQDPTNTGSIIRTAIAHNITHFVLAPNTPDPFNPLVLRSSAGTAFLGRYALYDKLKELIEEGIPVFRAEAHEGAGLPGVSPERFILMLGHETLGVTGKYSEAGTPITLPSAHVESLGVSAAAAILIYELTKPSARIT